MIYKVDWLRVMTACSLRWCLSTLLFVTLGSGCSIGHRQYKDQELVDLPQYSIEHLRKTSGSAESQEVCNDIVNSDGTVTVELSRSPLFVDDCGWQRGHSRITFSIIEFDDEGVHWDRDQMGNTKQAIRMMSEAQPVINEKTGIVSDGIFLVTFIHGWRNSASERSSSLRGFRKFVKNLASSEQVCSRKSPIRKQENTSIDNIKLMKCVERPHIVAVYLSWRGDSAGPLLGSLKFPAWFTFWGRKAAALRVAGTPMTETLMGLLFELEQADKGRFARITKAEGPKELDRLPPSSRSLIIGHSFGARVLEHAVAAALIGRRLSARSEHAENLKTSLDTLEYLQQQDLIWITLRNEEVKKEKQAQEDKKTLKVNLNQINSKILNLDEEIGDLEVESDLLDVYFQPKIATVDQLRMCRAFNEEWVSNCSGGSKDIWLLGSCVLNEVACVFRGYSCPIQASLKKLNGYEGEAADQCQVVLPKLLTQNDGQAGLSIIKKGDSLADWTEFLKDLKSHWARLPLPLPYKDNNKDEELTQTVISASNAVNYFSSASSFLSEFQTWNRRLAPSFVQFAPRNPLVDDDTEDTEESVITALEFAEKYIEEHVVNQARTHLADAKLQLEKQQKRAKLKIEKQELVSQRDTNQKTINQRHKEAIEASNAIMNIDKAIEQVEKEANVTKALSLYELDSTLRPPADLLLLVNPATEAMSAQNLINALCSTDAYSEQALNSVPSNVRASFLNDSTRRPWIVSITSKEDEATKRLFPWAVRAVRWLSRVPSRSFGSRSSVCDNRRASYRELMIRTAGHVTSLHSHEIERITENDKDELIKFPLDKPKYTLRHVSSDQDGLNNNDGNWQYWIASVPPEIVADHNKIFEDDMNQLVLRLIDLSQMFKPICRDNISTCVSY